MTSVGPPAGEFTKNLPPAERIRSWIPESPPPGTTRAPPRPKSRTPATTMFAPGAAPSWMDTATSAERAPEYLIALLRLSETAK